MLRVNIKILENDVRILNVSAMSTLGALLDSHDAIGNPNHPILAPDIFVTNTGSIDVPFLQRLDALLYNIWYRALYRWIFVPNMDIIARKYFGNNFPSILEIQSRTSLLFVTENPILNMVRPNIPTVINLEQLHIDTPKPLPKV